MDVALCWKGAFITTYFYKEYFIVQPECEALENCVQEQWSCSLVQHSGGGSSLQGKDYPECEIYGKFLHFLDLASDNKIRYSHIKYSFKTPLFFQRAERRDTEENKIKTNKT